MKTRCLNEKSKDYQWYGARGVTVCERWRTFANFFADMGTRPEGMTLDRSPDTTGNYEPGNCRWASADEQQTNKRNANFIEYAGERMTCSQWARRYGLGQPTLHFRLAAGWPIAEALTTPSRAINGRKGPLRSNFRNSPTGTI